MSYKEPVSDREGTELARVGQTIGKVIVPILQGRGQGLTIVQTGPASYIAVPAWDVTSVTAVDAYREAQSILTAAIRQARFLGLHFDSISALHHAGIAELAVSEREPAFVSLDPPPVSDEIKDATYRTIITGILSASDEGSRSPTERLHYICDTARDRYALYCEGWVGFQRISYLIVYMRLYKGKVWVEAATPDQHIIDKLLRAGIPLDDIVTHFEFPDGPLP